MKLTTSATITSAFVLIAAPAPAAAERLYITPSGMAETVFVNTSHEEAANKIANTCASAGWAVTREMMAVKCEPKMNLFAQALTNALTAPRYASSVREFMHFSLTPDGRQTRVQARHFQSHTTAFGQYNETDITTDESFNARMSVMGNAGATLPVGTSFGRRPWWGVNWEETKATIFGQAKRLVQVTHVTVGSPADRAGIQPGDMLFKVNGKECRDTKSCIKAGDGVRIGEAFNFQIIRAGEQVNITFTAESRPIVTELEGCNDICLTPPTGSSASDKSNSFARDLENLHSLYKAGALTAAEFDAAKKRVLDGKNP